MPSNERERLLLEREKLQLEMEMEAEGAPTEQVDVSFAPSTATDEELHEANLNTGGQTRLDTPMGGKVVAPLAQPLMEQAGAFLGAPKRMLGGLVDIAKDVGRMDEPLDTKLINYGKKAIGGLGDALGKLVYGSHVEQAGVAGDMTLGMASGNIGRGFGAATGARLPSIKKMGAEFRRGPGAVPDIRPAATRKLDDALATFNTSLGVSATDPAPFFPGGKNKTAWNVARDNAIAPFVEKLVKPVDTFGMSKLAKHTTERFWSDHYGQFEEFMSNQKVDPERVQALAAKLESSLDPIVDKAGNRMLQNFANSLKERTDWSFDDFERFRRQFNEKQKYKKGTTTSDVAQRREIILGEVRSLLNDEMDNMIDQGVPMADVLRQYRDMRMVTERVNEIAAAASQAKSVKDVSPTINMQPATTAKGSAIVTVRASAGNIYKKHVRNTSDPDFLMRKATSELIKQKDKLPVPEVVKLGLKKGKRKAIPLGPSSLEGVAAIHGGLGVEPSGPIPLSSQGLGNVFEGLSKGQGTPSQLALPPASSTQLPGGFSQLDEVNAAWMDSLKRNTPPNQKALPGRIMGGSPGNLLNPQGGYYPKSPSMTSPATPESSTRLFRGDIRGGYSFTDPAQQAEKRRAILGRPYIDSEGNIKYRK